MPLLRLAILLQTLRHGNGKGGGGGGRAYSFLLKLTLPSTSPRPMSILAVFTLLLSMKPSISKKRKNSQVLWLAAFLKK